MPRYLCLSLVCLVFSPLTNSMFAQAPPRAYVSATSPASTPGEGSILSVQEGKSAFIESDLGDITPVMRDRPPGATPNNSVALTSSEDTTTNLRRLSPDDKESSLMGHQDELTTAVNNQDCLFTEAAPDSGLLSKASILDQPGPPAASCMCVKHIDVTLSGGPCDSEKGCVGKNPGDKCANTAKKCTIFARDAANAAYCCCYCK